MIKNATMAEKVYNILWQSIINLTLKPGSMVSEKDIAERLSVSRTPVREAFIKLSKEGLVTIVPQRGTFISKINFSQVYEEKFLRESLEKECVKLFIITATESSFKRLEKNIEKQEKVIESFDRIKFLDYDDQFHRIIFEETKKLFCHDIIQKMSGNYRRVRMLSNISQEIMQKNMEEHKALLETLINKDVEKAIGILQFHIDKIAINSDEIKEKFPEYFEDTSIYIDENVLNDNLLNLLDSK